MRSNEIRYYNDEIMSRSSKYCGAQNKQSVDLRTQTIFISFPILGTLKLKLIHWITLRPRTQRIGNREESLLNSNSLTFLCTHGRICYSRDRTDDLGGWTRARGRCSKMQEWKTKLIFSNLRLHSKHEVKKQKNLSEIIMRSECERVFRFCGGCLWWLWHKKRIIIRNVIR